MQKSNVRICSKDFFSVEFENQSEYSVGCWMLGSGGEGEAGGSVSLRFCGKASRASVFLNEGGYSPKVDGEMPHSTTLSSR